MFCKCNIFSVLDINQNEVVSEESNDMRMLILQCRIFLFVRYFKSLCDLGGFYDTKFNLKPVNCS